MEEILKLGTYFLLQFGSPYGASFQRGVVRTFVCGFLALIAGLAALGFGVAALWLWIAQNLGAIPAVLICGGILLVLCSILGVTSLGFARRARTAPEAIAELLTSKEASALLQKHLPELMLAALVGGIVLGLRKERGRRS